MQVSPLRCASVEMTDLWWARRALQKAGPSTPLRFAQDDKLLLIHAIVVLVRSPGFVLGVAEGFHRAIDAAGFAGDADLPAVMD